MWTRISVGVRSCPKLRFGTGLPLLRRECSHSPSPLWRHQLIPKSSVTLPLKIWSEDYSTKTKAPVSSEPPFESLTSEETAKVLKLVNEVQRSEDLLKFIIPKKKADELVKWKNINKSQISSLDEVIAIVGSKNSNKFFCSVLDKPVPLSLNAAIFPVITSEDIGCIESVLSVVIVGDKISWTLISRSNAKGRNSLNIEALNQISYLFKPRMHFLTMLTEMMDVAKNLPESDLCLVEEYPATAPTPYMFNFHLQMAQAKSMLLGILHSRAKPPIIRSVKTVAVARLFNTFVGSEKVSGQHLVEDMLLNAGISYISTPSPILGYYSSVDAKVREGLSQSFLLNLAFWKLTNQVDK